MSKENCNICLQKLNKREHEILIEISDDLTPCFCSIVKRIYNLEKQVIKINK